MLYQGKDPRGHETSRTYRSCPARQFGDFDDSAALRDLNAPAGSRRLDLVCASRRSGVDDDLDAIALHRCPRSTISFFQVPSSHESAEIVRPSRNNVVMSKRVRSSLYFPAADLETALRQIAELRVHTVIFDVEPLATFWDTDEASLSRGIDLVFDRTARLCDVAVVGFATNSARRPVAWRGPNGHRIFYLANALKPLRIAPYRGLPGPGAVVGDQVATDGILARRLGYAFIHYRPVLDRLPAGPRLMRQLGRPLRRVLFEVSG